jgi:NADPH:quinone reductase
LTNDIPATMLQLHSTVKSAGELEVSLAEVPVPEPRDDQVLVRVEAAPINPSDLGLLLGGADLRTAKATGTADRPVTTADIPKAMLGAMKARYDQPLPCGNEGGGVVVKAGKSDAAQALLGKTVAILGGSMYGQYRCVPASVCLVLPEGTKPAEGASCFVNPLTALGMVETMRLEGHKALVHTAAASNLGQMLNRLCLQDGIPLVNIVRKDEHVELLKAQGAKYVLNSTSETFQADLTEALKETGATIGFDATGGGELAGQILGCMEAALSASGGAFNRYGSSTHKQVYIYGGLERSATMLYRNYGMAWGLGGWLLTPFLERIGPEAAQKLRERVAAEIKTTFASQYTDEISLAEALDPEVMKAYGRQATGRKYLINPNK